MAPGLETFPLALAASHEALLRWHGTARATWRPRRVNDAVLRRKRQFFKNARKSSAEMGFAFLPMPDTDHDGAYFSPGSAVGAVAKFLQLHLK
jgi:hypothetical protein